MEQSFDSTVIFLINDTHAGRFIGKKGKAEFDCDFAENAQIYPKKQKRPLPQKLKKNKNSFFSRNFGDSRLGFNTSNKV